jgi:hypothetical protein
MTEWHAGDDSRSLFARADSALYSAKAAGLNRLFVHNGAQIREHVAGAAAAASRPGSGVRSTNGTVKTSGETFDANSCPVDDEELAVR